MKILAIALAAFHTFGSLLVVLAIDKPREPITHSTAVWTLIISALTVWALVWGVMQG